MTFNADARHPLYVAFAPAWQIMRDAIGGDDDVKARGQAYLPMKTAQAAMTDVSLQDASYNAYRTRAEFPEITAPTITGSAGLICSQPPTFKLPSRMEILLERATLDDLSLETLYEMVVVELLSTGRYGLLPSFDQATGEPYLAGYTTESIVNWDDDPTLRYVALDESRYVRDESNSWRHQRKFRELVLTDSGLEGRLWIEGSGGFMGDGSETYLKSSTSGTAIDFMPLVVMGTRAVTINPDDVPLYGLAKTALRMYRLDADYQTALHMTSEPTPWVSGFDDPVSAMQDGAVPSAIGASNLWVLPNGAQCGFLEFSGPGLQAQRAAIDAEREAAASFGARMFDETNRAPESGESRKVRYSHNTASLKTIAKVAAAGIERALRNQAKWMGIDDQDAVSVSPNLDWVTDAMTPAELEKLVKAWQDGAISYNTLFDRLKAGKIVSAEREMEEEVRAILDDPLKDDLSPDVDPEDPEAGTMPTRQPSAATTEPASPAL